MQENGKFWLYEETVNHIISKCGKLAQKKYETRNKWVGMLIH